MDKKAEDQSIGCSEILKKGVWNVGVTIFFGFIIAALLICSIVFVCNDYPEELQEVQTIERSNKCQTKTCKQNQNKVCCKSRCCVCCCNSCCGFVQDDSPIESSENANNSSAAFITFIICASCVLAIAIVCVALLAINANKSELTRKELCALKLEKDAFESLLKDTESKVKETTENGLLSIEYYPKNKAAADIFKAFANAIADI